MDLRTEPGTTLRVPMSRAEFEALPEERFAEWWDGFCVVNPPLLRHARIVSRLVSALRSAISPDLEIYVQGGVRTEDADLIPDLVVAPSTATDVWLIDPPLLVVEVLSPSTRQADLGFKRATYAAHGVPWYWLVDPESATLIILRNEDGEYVEAQQLTTEGVSTGPVSIELNLDAICR